MNVTKLGSIAFTLLLAACGGSEHHIGIEPGDGGSDGDARRKVVGNEPTDASTPSNTNSDGMADSGVGPAVSALDNLVVTLLERTSFASGEYAEVHTGRESYLLQITLGELLACLDPEGFERVHRSHIVNLDAVDHLRPADDRRLLVTLRDGTTLLASRAASERIRRRVR